MYRSHNLFSGSLQCLMLITFSFISATTQANDSAQMSAAVVQRPVTISGFYEDHNTPAQTGAIVFINGKLVGTFDSAGQYRTTLPIGKNYTIRVVEVGLVAGNSEIALTAESPAEISVSIIMKSAAALLEVSQMEVEGISKGILNNDFTSLTLRFVRPDGSTIKIVGFSYIDLVSLKNEDNKIDVSDYFSLATDGSLVLVNADAFRTAVMGLPVGDIRLRVATASDSIGLLYAGEIDFYVGHYSVGGP